MLGVCVGDSFWVVNPEGIALSVAMWIGGGGVCFCQKNCNEIVTKLSLKCHGIVTKMSQKCHEKITKMSPSL